MNPEKTPLNQLHVYGFYSHNPKKYPGDRSWFACFSNWYPSLFKSNCIDNGVSVEFVNVEQFLMYMKALTFKDSEIAAKILLTSDPGTIKALGRQVKGYNDAQWVKVRYQILLKGVRAKFEQDKQLKQHLLDTVGKTLAEAAPTDCAYGIGLKTTDPNTQDETKWKGQNLLGKALMEVRDEFVFKS